MEARRDRACRIARMKAETVLWQPSAGLMAERIVIFEGHFVRPAAALPIHSDH